MLYTNSCQTGNPALYIEYSDQNIRLTRCPECLRVTDKYIEYELFLVLIDILLHEKPAYRHLIFNRYNTIVTEVRVLGFRYLLQTD
jgi:hypothetical protein